MVEGDHGWIEEYVDWEGSYGMTVEQHSFLCVCVFLPIYIHSFRGFYYLVKKFKIYKCKYMNFNSNSIYCTILENRIYKVFIAVRDLIQRCRIGKYKI